MLQILPVQKQPPPPINVLPQGLTENTDVPEVPTAESKPPLWSPFRAFSMLWRHPASTPKQTHHPKQKTLTFEQTQIPELKNKIASLNKLLKDHDAAVRKARRFGLYALTLAEKNKYSCAALRALANERKRLIKLADGIDPLSELKRPELDRPKRIPRFAAAYAVNEIPVIAGWFLKKHHRVVVGRLGDIRICDKRSRCVAERHVTIRVRYFKRVPIFEIRDGAVDNSRWRSKNWIPSKKGTFVNGKRIKDWVPIENGDLIEFGFHSIAWFDPF